jgi:hypothetical protein
MPVPNTLVALHVNPETGLTHVEVDTRRKEQGSDDQMARSDGGTSVNPIDN